MALLQKHRQARPAHFVIFSYAECMTLSGIRARIQQLLATKHSPTCHWQALGQGVGGHTWRVTGADTAWFAKLAADAPEILTAEVDGLRALAECRAVHVPRVAAAGDGFLVLEWLDFGAKTEHAATKLGERLAKQHRCSGKQFGWPLNNFIGATPQFNATRDNWVKFFGEHRLGFQLRLAAENGCRGELQERGERLLEKLSAFFPGYSPQPSLLHGDLWSGNWGVLQTGEPVIFDPAVYYGDREADLAMTELFGGFPPEFYSAYDAHWPRDPGYAARRDLYNLYHVLNHLNLFGGAYHAQALDLMHRLNAETG